MRAITITKFQIINESIVIGILDQDEVCENGNEFAFCLFVFFKFQQKRRLTRADLDNEIEKEWLPPWAFFNQCQVTEFGPGDENPWEASQILGPASQVKNLIA